jgi:predicted acyl esterase
MSLISRLVGHLWKLPAAVTRDIAVEPLRIPVRDGIELLADRYYARQGAAQATVLIRSCYGRGSLFKLIAILFAERGMQVVVQSCRGTAGSQGRFGPFFNEQNDGEDTVEWMERQPWFHGDLALWSASYLGNTAWAIANSKAGSKVKALGLHEPRMDANVCESRMDANVCESRMDANVCESRMDANVCESRMDALICGTLFG